MNGSPDERIRRLERAVRAGDSDAIPRLDSALRQTGRAPGYYALTLLSLIPQEWRVRGYEVSWEDVNFVVHLLDGSIWERIQRGRERRRPSVALCVPDGFGGPRIFRHPLKTGPAGWSISDSGEYVPYGDYPRLDPNCRNFEYVPNRDPDSPSPRIPVCLGHVRGGIEIRARFSAMRGAQERRGLVSSGGLTLDSTCLFPSVRVGNFMSPDRKLRPGWTDSQFLRAASYLYSRALDFANLVGPTVRIVARAKKYIDRLSSRLAESMDPEAVRRDPNLPHREAYEELASLAREEGLPMVGYETGPLSSADLVGWDELLTSLPGW